MNLRVKFNLVLLLAFALGLGLSAYFSDLVLRDNAREEVAQSARIMMASAQSARVYTVEHIQPLLAAQMKRQFVPESVSAYAAAQSFKALRNQFPDYTYKEASLNPTNLNDRATDWEADIIKEFRNFPERKEVIIERETPTGRVLNFARPLLVRDQGCLVCHGRKEDASKAMIEIYGDSNGFGWKLGDVFGAQIVSVPMALPIARAEQSLITFMILQGGVFLWLLLLLNVLLHFVVIKPVVRMAHIANEVSLGTPDVPEYVKPGKDEIASLSRSFNRMRLSLAQAMHMLESPHD